jgi:hypothetical protein
MAKIILGCEPPSPLYFEIEEGLHAVGVNEYTAHTHFLDSDGLSIAFTVGEVEQSLEFKKGEWRKEDVVSKAIVDHLNI